MESPLEEQAGDAESQDIDHDATDDLVDEKAHREDGVKRRDQHAGHYRRQHAEPETVGEEGHHVAGECAHQHHALKRDVDHAGSLAHDAAKGGQREWRGLVESRGEAGRR